MVKSLKKKINVTGPFPADTIFLENNRKKFDIIIGMYHDQVLTPIKTIFEYEVPINSKSKLISELDSLT